MRPTRLISAALLVLLLGMTNALDPTPIALTPTPTLSALASCFFQHESQSTGLNVPLALKLDGQNACDATVITFTCFDGDSSHTLLRQSDSQCLFPTQFNCQYAQAGSYVVSAWMHLGSSRISCGTTQVTAQCLSNQEGLQCGDNAFCCQSQCLGRPTSCGACTVPNQFQCANSGWQCAPAADGTACADACFPQNLSVSGVCQSGSCFQQVRLCTVDSYCTSSSCSNSAYYCSFNQTDGQFEWSSSNSCQGISCPSDACITTPSALTYYNFTAANGVCSLNSAECHAGGCCRNGCDTTLGCSTASGSCADVCEAEAIKVSGSCQGCGVANAIGACAYVTSSCGPSNECQTLGCGGRPMVCRNTQGRYGWSNDTSTCISARPTISQESSLGDNLPSPTPTIAQPTPKVYEAGSDAFTPTVLPKNVRFQHLVNATAVPEFKGEENSAISVLSFYFDRKVIDPALRINAFIYTDSRKTLQRDLECSGPSGCICHPPIDGNFSNFRCEFYPPVNGTYFIRLRNAENETGVFVARLLPGEEAQLYKLVVPLRNREYFVYGLAVVIGILTLYGVYRLMRAPLSKVSQRPRLEKRKSELAKEMDFLKYRLMKGEISDVQYRQSLFVKEKELTDVLARLKELDERLEEPGPG